MSTNSLLASLYGTTSNHSSTTRSSSLFTKQYSFMTNNNSQQKNRPSSVSKTIQDSSPNDLIKWTPLIKTVHKLSAKMKKNYFFFWCRMEAHVKSNNKHINQNKQNIKEIQNIPVETKRQQIKEKIPLTQNNLLMNKENTEQKIFHQTQILSKSSQIYQKKQSVIQIQQLPKVSLLQNILIPQKLFEKQDFHINNSSQNLMKKSEQERLKKQKEIKLQNFIISLSKLGFRLQSVLTLSSFKALMKYSNKVLSIQKICALQFNQSKKNYLFQVFRNLKRHSHLVMKSQILINCLRNLIKKNKIQAVKFLSKKTSDQNSLNQLKEQTKKIQVKKTEKIKISLDLEKLSLEKIIEKDQQTPRFNIQENSLKLETKTNVIQNEIPQKSVQNAKMIPLKLNVAKNVTQFWISSNTKSSISIKTDKHIENDFIKESKNEIMKKINRLYPEEPFFQLPDISEITLFDSVIKNNSNIFEKKRAQNKSINTSLVSSIKLYTSRQKQTSLISTDNLSKQDIPISPRFDEHLIKSRNSQQLFRKASSCANITVIKNSSSSNLKNNPNTPGSGKKIIGLFSKKKSVQLFSKDSGHKNYQSKLESAKSAVLKKFDLFAQMGIKPQKQKQNLKEKMIKSGSKENHRNQTNRKVQKQKQKQKKHQTKNSTTLNFSQTKQNQDSSKKSHNQNSSKVIQKFYDMSARRIGTGSKKQISSCKRQNQIQNLYQKGSSKKLLIKNQSCKENQLSEFNTLSNKVISYQEFMRHFPTERQATGRTPLKQVCVNEPIFQTIQMTEQDFSSKDLNQCYGSCSAQLMKGRIESNQQKSKKLRTKIDKIEVNTARKMKMQIQNMISQRKKNSIGILKF